MGGVDDTAGEGDTRLHPLLVTLLAGEIGVLEHLGAAEGRPPWRVAVHWVRATLEEPGCLLLHTLVLILDKRLPGVDDQHDAVELQLGELPEGPFVLLQAPRLRAKRRVADGLPGAKP